MRVPSAEDLLMVLGATADQLSKPIESELRGVPVSEDIEPRPELHWTSLVFALHLLDRWTLMRLGFSERELAMGSIQALLWERLGPAAAEALRQDFNAFNARHGQHQHIFAQEGERLQGTLCWELAKGLQMEFAHDQLGSLALIAMCTTHTAAFLIKCCDQIALAPEYHDRAV